MITPTDQKTQYLQMQEDQEHPEFYCPSFNSYSTNRIADTAARVSNEIAVVSDLSPALQSINGEDEDDDFEFVSLQKTDDGGPVFIDRPIGPLFPIFNRPEKNEMIDGNNNRDYDKERVSTSIRIPLEKLIICDRIRDRDTPSSSSSEVDELEGIQPGSYCVWTPKTDQSARAKCKKSKSTGSSSSKRWSIIDFLRRSNSDGKNSFVFLTPSSRNNSLKKEDIKVDKDLKGGIKSSGEVKLTGAVRSKGKGVSGEKVSSAHEEFYVRNRMLKEEGKRKSYLPYKQGLVGSWANVNSLGRTFPPI